MPLHKYKVWTLRRTEDSGQICYFHLILAIFQKLRNDDSLLRNFSSLLFVSIIKMIYMRLQVD